MPLPRFVPCACSQVDAAGDAASDGAASDVGGGGKTQTIEHTFDTPDGTPQDDSLSQQERAELEAVQREEERKRREEADADRVNTTPGEKYHVICSLGSGIYVQWQSRVVSQQLQLRWRALQRRARPHPACRCRAAASHV